MSLSLGPYEITQDLLKQFADASGDYNPIHLNEAEAKRMGLAGVIAHGMLIASWAATGFEKVAKSQGVEWKLKEEYFRFRAMTFIGEKIRVEVDSELKEGQLKVQARCFNEAGELKTQGSAIFVREQA